MARPSKFSPQVRKAILDAVEAGNFRDSAARAAGVGPRTLDRWLQLGLQYPDGEYGAFRAALLAAEGKAEAALVRTIFDMARSDWKAAAWWLERKFPQRWGRFRGEFTELQRRVRELEKMVRPDDLQPEREGA